MKHSFSIHISNHYIMGSQQLFTFNYVSTVYHETSFAFRNGAQGEKGEDQIWVIKECMENIKLV